MDQHEDDLRTLCVQRMQATREEDRREILAKIPNYDIFNAHLQHLLFEDLLPSWSRLDVAKQLDQMGHVLRWREVCHPALDIATPAVKIVVSPTSIHKSGPSPCTVIQ